MIEAVIFDLDGVLLDSEQIWDEARRALVEERGGRWLDGAQRDMMGMSAPEWSRYMHEELGVGLSPEAIATEVAARLGRLYRERLPLMPGAVAAVRRIGARWPLGLASSANRSIIDLVLDLAGLAGLFAVTVSSEEVPKGKPAPDVYVDTARRIRVAPSRAAAIEDSTNGIRSALAAGMLVIAISNTAFPPDPGSLSEVHRVLRSLAELEPSVIEQDPRARPTSS